jgi:transcriptional regulator with PAS, ATPase and Fis domain
MTKTCCELLEKYHWPGNVRELANVIERLIVLCTGDCIMPGDLPKELLCKSGWDNGDSVSTSLKEQLRNIETKIIADAVEKYGNARRAAMHLKVNPSTVCRKLNSRATTRTVSIA